MSRYIDADKLIRKYIDTDIEKFSNSDVKIVLENLKQNILRAQSIDICFCRECKLGGTEDCPMDEIDDEYFCNFGEREGE